MTLARRAPRGLPCLILCLLAQPAAALELAWPEDAERVLSRSETTVAYPLATGGFADGAVPLSSGDGTLVEEVWQVPGAPGDTETLFALLRDQLAAQGYEIGFTCADTACGGFDFRYALPIAEGPAMHVDLGDFRYISASRPTAAGAEHVALTVSHGGELGYAHLAWIVPTEAAAPSVVPSTRVSGDPSDGGLIARLTTEGHAVLEDLAFDTGASALSDQRYDSLVTLADWLAENPDRRIVLVGHTDAEGALESNVALSRARAAAVRDALVTGLGADPARIEAAGVGYLAPRAANNLPEGREANRRVEVVLISG
ncbi:OmpA family protein [Rhodobacterales bacterium HKCCSP123]|nr:OmpA family protein [Rhodobacterales bacterium HKCCSP123]